jgi:hypothetical protein
LFSFKPYYHLFWFLESEYFIPLMYRAGIVRKEVKEGVLENDVTVNESMAILALLGVGVIMPNQTVVGSLCY